MYLLLHLRNQVNQVKTYPHSSFLSTVQFLQ
uniref:Uncharacterized protein n=1 Tax=Anguilla anguilla TaxID=7936 RepID=A0A0E9U2G3_ANGAN